MKKLSWLKNSLPSILYFLLLYGLISLLGINLFRSAGEPINFFQNGIQYYFVLAFSAYAFRGQLAPQWIQIRCNNLNRIFLLYIYQYFNLYAMQLSLVFLGTAAFTWVFQLHFVFDGLVIYFFSMHALCLLIYVYYCVSLQDGHSNVALVGLALAIIMFYLLPREGWNIWTAPYSLSRYGGINFCLQLAMTYLGHLLGIYIWHLWQCGRFQGLVRKYSAPQPTARGKICRRDNLVSSLRYTCCLGLYFLFIALGSASLEPLGLSRAQLYCYQAFFCTDYMQETAASAVSYWDCLKFLLFLFIFFWPVWLSASEFSATASLIFSRFKHWHQGFVMMARFSLVWAAKALGRTLLAFSLVYGSMHVLAPAGESLALLLVSVPHLLLFLLKLAIWAFNFAFYLSLANLDHEDSRHLLYISLVLGLLVFVQKLHPLFPGLGFCFNDKRQVISLLLALLGTALASLGACFQLKKI